MTIEIVDLPISMVIFQFAMLVHQRVHHFMDGFWWNIHQKMDDWGFNSVPGLQALIVPSCLGYPWEKPKLWPHKFDQTYGQKPSDQNSGFYMRQTPTNQKTPRLLLISWSPAPVPSTFLSFLPRGTNAANVWRSTERCWQNPGLIVWLECDGFRSLFGPDDIVNIPQYCTTATWL